MNDIRKKYLVTGTWHDKTTGKPMSGMLEVTSGINKAGQSYGILNSDSREAPIERLYPVGTILTATVNFVQERPSKAPLNLKSGS